MPVSRHGPGLSLRLLLFPKVYFQFLKKLHLRQVGIVFWFLIINIILKCLNFSLIFINCYELKSNIKRYLNSLQQDCFLVFELPYSESLSELCFDNCSKSHTQLVNYKPVKNLKRCSFWKEQQNDKFFC